MTSFLRGKQAGMQNDLSMTIQDIHFAPDDQARYGINSQIRCLAYDPVQSLLAVGTKETSYGQGKIYVFGINRVTRTLEYSDAHNAAHKRPGRTDFVELKFFGPGASVLLSLDSHSDLSIWDLRSGQRVTGFPNPGSIAAICTDPSLDWAFLGLTMGDILAYDLDRFRLSSFRLHALWRQYDPHVMNLRLLTLALHPTDVGKLMVAYNRGVAIFNFKQDKTQKYLEYIIPAGAPGGDGRVSSKERRPDLMHAVWHPSGTFLLTVHDDGSLVFWDPSQGRILMARSLTDTHVNRPTQAQTPDMGMESKPVVKVAWCCKKNPDDTALLIAGGTPNAGLSFLDLGQTPVYATSSWQILESHFEGKKQSALPTPPGVAVVDFVLIPRDSPHYAGAQDPLAVIGLLSSGELITMSFPSGYPISPTNMLHPSLSLVHPFVAKTHVNVMDRERWISMMEGRLQGELLVKGGAEGPRARRRGHDRSIIQVAHGDATVRLWDVGHGDQVENPRQLQVDVARAVGRFDDVQVTAMDLSSITGEFVVGTSCGEVVIWRWGLNPHPGHDTAKDLPPNPGEITDITCRAEPPLKEGLMPTFLYEMMQGPISAVRASDIGFVAVGSETGHFSVIDLRGPKVIYTAVTSDFIKAEKRSSILRHSHSTTAPPKEWATIIEFGVMTLDDDSYSSIACFVGTNLGHVATFKLLPADGGYNVKPAGVQNSDDKVVALCPIVSDTGKSAVATGQLVSGLRSGQNVNGALVVVTQSEARIFKPATSKGASKSFDDFLVHSAAVTSRVDVSGVTGHALVTVSNDKTARAFTLPGLKEINSHPLPKTMVDPEKSIITSEGDVLVWVSPSELALLQVWGTGEKLEDAVQDMLINPDLQVPPRPTISNLQWISGTQYISPSDLNLLIWPDRPPRRGPNGEILADSEGPGGITGGPGEGWGEYMMRMLNERTDKLNMVNDGMQNLSDASAQWANEMGQVAKKQKRNMLLGGLGSKFGL